NGGYCLTARRQRKEESEQVGAERFRRVDASLVGGLAVEEMRRSMHAFKFCSVSQRTFCCFDLEPIKLIDDWRTFFTLDRNPRVCELDDVVCAKQMERRTEKFLP